MSRALGLLFLAGATIGLLSLVLPQSPHANVPALEVNIAIASVGGILFLALGRHAPKPLFHVAVVGGTLLITRAIYYSGREVSFYSVWYVWVALFAFYFFPRRSAVAHGLLLSAAYAAVLALRRETTSTARWLTTVSTVLVAGAFIDALLTRWRREKSERLALLDRLERMASTDDLTGLPNRRAWHEQLTLAMDRARRDDRMLCVAMLDLDGFKALNDARGHMAGDQMLKELAAVWSSSLRSTDLLARYGGDEFVLLLPRCELAVARRVLDRLREVTPAGASFSAGLAEWDGASDAESLIVAADNALYEAKRGDGAVRAVAR